MCPSLVTEIKAAGTLGRMDACKRITVKLKGNTEGQCSDLVPNLYTVNSLEAEMHCKFVKCANGITLMMRWTGIQRHFCISN